jgi:hypothetical protein
MIKFPSGLVATLPLAIKSGKSPLSGSLKSCSPPVIVAPSLASVKAPATV